ncbi:MAG TPA: FHA domain-containing protein [Kineosporiaceae bacterium]|nr:FHA domain-containing protein [Kineosporiaceae bacterium]
MTSTCPAGHTSESNDYCDVCGAPIGAGGGTAGGPGSGGAGAAASGAAASGAAPSGTGGAAGQAGSSGPGSLLDLDSPSAAAGRACPNCGAQAMPGALFCEDCGYDFTTGQLPRTDPPPLIPPAGMTDPPQLPVDLSAAGPSAAVPPPLPPTGSGPVTATGASPAGPTPAGTAAAGTTPAQEGPVDWVAEVWVDPEWHAAQEVTEPCPSPGMPVVVPLRGTTQLVGRRSASRNIHPQIDVGADTGVSRRHAQLTTDGQRWWVEDLQSSNGTFVGTAGGGLPDTPVPPGQRTELPDDARVYVGAWTRIVVRSATDDERVSAG